MVDVRLYKIVNEHRGTEGNGEKMRGRDEDERDA